MKKLTQYEMEVLKRIETELSIPEKIILKIFKKYTFKVFQAGVKRNFFN